MAEFLDDLHCLDLSRTVDVFKWGWQLSSTYGLNVFIVFCTKHPHTLTSCWLEQSFVCVNLWINIYSCVCVVVSKMNSSILIAVLWMMNDYTCTTLLGIALMAGHWILVVLLFSSKWKQFDKNLSSLAFAQKKNPMLCFIFTIVTHSCIT